jgi:hypothetical protein
MSDGRQFCVSLNVTKKKSGNHKTVTKNGEIDCVLNFNRVVGGLFFFHLGFPPSAHKGKATARMNGGLPLESVPGTKGRKGLVEYLIYKS